MSRLNAPGISSRPINNIYTAIALVGMLCTLGAVVYVVLRMMDLKLL